MSATFPDVTTRFALLGAPPHDPANKGPFYSPIFRAHNETGDAIATLNAGDNGLYVGGGTINLAFGNQMGADADLFLSLHQAALKNARAGNHFVTIFDDGPAKLISVHLSPDDAGSGGCPAETVFLDVFADNRWPKQNAANAIMIYAVPPDGTGHALPVYKTDDDFLNAVERTAESSVRALADYNLRLVPADTTKSLKAVPVLRTCLFSGGQFRPQNVKKDDVAGRIFNGFAKALKATNGGGITLIEFESANAEFASVGH
jgi:hypothetical protein